ncbi:MAG: hypothetical protein EHM36_07535 [Deltaproteobacteria bacterium]|nr:MAG: hypothetical protein EHM36_07535 [Deltaproteobacteria bacterium]
MDEGDADIATFFYYMGLAIRKTFPGRKPLPRFDPAYNTAVFTRRYFEDLFSRLSPARLSSRKPNSRIPPFKKKNFSSFSSLGKDPSFSPPLGKGGVIIVLDNYHDAPLHSKFHEMIHHGLDVTPERVAVFILSRGEPPPALARLRANNKMNFLGWDELRLTFDESARIVRQRTRGIERKETIEHLYKATEGWAAGLVLMSESFERAGGEAQTLQKLVPKEIIDYFGNELFDKTAPKVQEFLLKTVFLPKTTAKMAEAITGLHNADEILSTLSRNNYFTVKRFHSDPVFEYHRLFREFLFSRAKDFFSLEEISEIQKQAGILL